MQQNHEQLQHRLQHLYIFLQIFLNETRKAKSNIEALERKLMSAGFDFIGPGLAFFGRIRDKWRYHIIIKSKIKGQRSTLQKIYFKHRDLTWDTDAYDLL